MTDQTPNDRQRATEIIIAIDAVGKFDPNLAQVRLGKAQGLLYRLLDVWDDARLRAASSNIRAIGANLMKLAAKLDRLAEKRGPRE